MKFQSILIGCEDLIKHLFSTIRNPAITLSLAKLFFKFSIFTFILILARNFSASQFGDFQFISSVANILAQPAYSLAMIVVYFGIQIKAYDNPKQMAWMIKISAFFCCLLTVTIVLTFFRVEESLSSIANISVRYGVTLGGVIVAGSVVFNIAIGLLLTQQKFLNIAVAYFAIGLFTVFGGLGIIMFGGGHAVAFGIQASALFSTTLFIFIFLRRKFLNSEAPVATAISWRSIKYSINAIIVMLAFFTLLNADVLAIKILLPPNTANSYLQIELLSKLFFVFASSVGPILFALVMRKDSVAIDNYHLNPSFLLNSSFLVLSVCLILVVTLIADPLLDFIFGRSIQTDSTLIILLLTGRLAQSLIFILISARGESLNREWALLMLFLAAIEVALLSLYADSALEVAGIMCALSIAGIFLVWKLGRRMTADVAT